MSNKCFEYLIKMAKYLKECMKYCQFSLLLFYLKASIVSYYLN